MLARTELLLLVVIFLPAKSLNDVLKKFALSSFVKLISFFVTGSAHKSFFCSALTTSLRVAFIKLETGGASEYCVTPWLSFHLKISACANWPVIETSISGAIKTYFFALLFRLIIIKFLKYRIHVLTLIEN